MRTVVFFFAICLFFIPSGILAQGCGSPENVFSFMFLGKKYEIIKETYSWAIASECAVERGGYLVQINSQAEQDTVYKSIINGAKISRTYKNVNDGGGASYIWIGATDKATEGKWLWDGNNDGVGSNFWNGQGQAGSNNGAAVTGFFNNWGGASLNPTDPSRRKEPDDWASNQDGAAMALAPWPAPNGGLGIAGEWNDISSSNQIYFVVEFDSTSSTNIEELHTQVTVFPNPAVSHIRITSAGNNNPLVSIRIYNLLGSLLFEKKGIRTSDYTVNLQDFQTGAYFVQAQLESGQSVRRKIMIQ